MLYVKYIKLENFAQLKGRVYEQHYDPHMIYTFMGPNGSGKSSVVVEHDPRPTVHGFTTILKKKEGKKTIIYGDTDNKSYGLKVIHFYLPVKVKVKVKVEDEDAPARHSVKSFLYVLNNDEIVETVVNGSTNEFRDKMRKYFDVDYDSIKITGIGMKYGKSIFNLLGCNDTDRYNYIKSILSNLEEVKKMELHITTSLQVSNRRIKDLKSILGDISNVDFNTEMEKIKLDLKDYESVSDNLVRDKTKLDSEFEKINAISPSKRSEITNEYQEVKIIYECIKDIPNFISVYKSMKEEYNFILAQIRVLSEEHAKLVASRMSIKVSDNLLSKEEALRSLDIEISKLSEFSNDDLDLNKLDDAINKLDAMNNILYKLTSSADIIIEDYMKYVSNGDKYRELEIISIQISELDNKILLLKDEKKELNEHFVSQHEKELYRIEIDKADNCNTCPLYSLKENIDNRMRTIENNMRRCTAIDCDIEDMVSIISKLRIIYNNYVLFYDFLDGFKTNNEFISSSFSNDIIHNIHIFNDVSERVKNKKYRAMGSYRLKVLQARKMELESQEDVLSKINKLDSDINEINVKLGELNSKKIHIESNSLFKMKEEFLYKYTNVDLKEKIKELEKHISEISLINENTQKLQSELYVIESKFSELKDMQKRKQEDLTKLLLEKARFDETSSSYKFELEDNRKMNTMKVALTKKIPTILLNSYMVYVRNEANEILSDVDRYSVMLPIISYENNRNEFDIPINDYGDIKSCALLSKGEENLISLAIVLPIIYMSTKYRVLRLDELDSTLDPFLKQKFMDKIINLKPDKIVQIFMVTHSTIYAEHERVKIIRVAAA